MINKSTAYIINISVFLILLLLHSIPIQAQDWIYTTVEGDNLWSLSEKHLDSVMRFKQLKKINGIETPKRLQPGTKLRVPLKWIRSNPVSAQVVEFKGTVELQRSNGDIEQKLLPGTKIYLGDRLKSGPESSVAVKFADNTILTLHDDSLIRFDHLSAHGVTGMVDSRMHLLEGRMDTRVKPAVGPGTRFEIQTPSAISAVRGTEYRTSITLAHKASNIEVLHGKVAVSGAKKKTLVKAGFGTQVAQGKPPIPPKKLLEAPLLKPIPERIRSINWMVTWDAIKGALKYRVELADNAQFNTIIWQQFNQHMRTALPNIADGNYFIRVRAVDELGLEGKSVVQAIVLDAHPQPPVQLKPDEDFVLRGKTPELQWTASAEASRYRLEIAADADFKQLLVDRDDLEKTRFDASELSETGQYYWRLTSIAENGKHGPVGTEHAYAIKPVPEKVVPEMATADDGKLVATWPAGASGQTHQVQLAYDPEFKDLEMDQTLSAARISFDPLSGQVRYLRVRTIEADGYQGPWGTIQRVDPLPDKSIWLIPVLGILGLILL